MRNSRAILILILALIWPRWFKLRITRRKSRSLREIYPLYLLYSCIQIAIIIIVYNYNNNLMKLWIELLDYWGDFLWGTLIFLSWIWSRRLFNNRDKKWALSLYCLLIILLRRVKILICYPLVIYSSSNNSKITILWIWVWEVLFILRIKLFPRKAVILVFIIFDIFFYTVHFIYILFYL